MRRKQAVSKVRSSERLKRKASVVDSEADSTHEAVSKVRSSERLKRKASVVDSEADSTHEDYPAKAPAAVPMSRREYRKLHFIAKDEDDDDEDEDSLLEAPQQNGIPPVL
ncbi:UNVERIFIED_CONTAM: hypothetical protein FKN15_000705 [Acipenser sinensis]